MAEGEGSRPRRCSTCDVNWPAHILTCPACEGETWSMGAGAKITENWNDVLREARHNRLMGQQYPHPPDGVLPRYTWGPYKWFKHDDLLDQGYRYLQPGSIVYVNDAFWELESYSREYKAWWVTQVEHEGVFDNASPEDIIEKEEAD